MRLPGNGGGIGNGTTQVDTPTVEENDKKEVTVRVSKVEDSDGAKLITTEFSHTGEKWSHDVTLSVSAKGVFLHAERTDDVIARFQASGEAWAGATTWHGRRLMRISVSSQPGHGSEFVVELPVATYLPRPVATEAPQVLATLASLLLTFAINRAWTFR